MFKNLRTGTKLSILCGIFIILIGVTTYGLVAEKQIAIDFARKELVGNRYLAALRNIYAAILTSQSTNGLGPQPIASVDELLKELSSADSLAAGTFKTGHLEQALAAKLRELGSRGRTNEDVADLVLDTLASARALASRIGDESNLALDPDLDTYYVQDIVVARLPTLLGRFGEARSLLGGGAAPAAASSGRKVRLLVLEGLLRSTADEIQRDLAAAYRGNADGSLEQAIDDVFAVMTANSTSFLGRLNTSIVDDDAKVADAVAVERDYAGAVASAINAWAVAQTQLDRLLRQRVDGLREKLFRSLITIGALGALSIVIAVMTYRHIVQPLTRLEGLAKAVRETRNYGLRSDQNSQDEIGRLATAFNGMLSELSAARERELSEQSELARVTRLTTMGTATASIAHEINQPLAAIVTNGNVGLRWLMRAEPDLDEVRGALQRIVDDGLRAADVIGSIHLMFRKDHREKTLVNFNDIIREALALSHCELERHQVIVRTDLCEAKCEIMADRIQLQQVFLNLIRNAAEAMASVTDRARLLVVTSGTSEAGDVRITVEDAGSGIDPKDIDRIFHAFFTTKSYGMGMGLAICRSIIEAHDGRLWVSPGNPHGAVFHIQLPKASSAQ